MLRGGNARPNEAGLSLKQHTAWKQTNSGHSEDGENVNIYRDHRGFTGEVIPKVNQPTFIRDLHSVRHHTKC